MKPEQPNGRSLRGKLTNAFVQSLEAQWQQYGDSILDQLRQENPAKFAEIISRLCPVETVITEASPFSDCKTNEALAERLLLDTGAQRVTSQMIERCIEELARHSKALCAIAAVDKPLLTIEVEERRRQQTVVQ